MRVHRLVVMATAIALLACNGETPTKSTKSPAPKGSKSPAAGGSPSPGASESPTAGSPSPSPSPTSTAKTTTSPSPSPTGTAKASTSPSPSPTGSVKPSASPTTLASATPTPTPITVSTVAGSGTSGQTDGPGASATFSQPSAIVADSAGNLYVADSANNCIRKITFNAGAATVSTYAGDVAGGVGSTDDPNPLNARFNFPGGLAIDTAGTLYVADSSNNRIRKVAPNGGAVTTIAGSATTGAGDGDGAAAQFANPAGMALSGTNLYVADKDNHAIRKIDVSNTTYTVTTYAGGGGAGLVAGTGPDAKFFFPNAVAVDGQILYVVDSLNHRIRKVDDKKAVTTFAGLPEGAAGTAKGFADGTLDQARFDFTPGGGIAVGANHTLYIADPNNDRIRAISGTTIRTLAGVVDGTGRGGYAEGAGLTTAKFSSPMGVAVASDGTIYVADQGNNRIRKLK